MPMISATFPPGSPEDIVSVRDSWPSLIIGPALAAIASVGAVAIALKSATLSRFVATPLSQKVASVVIFFLCWRGFECARNFLFPMPPPELPKRLNEAVGPEVKWQRVSLSKQPRDLPADLEILFFIDSLLYSFEKRFAALSVF